MIVIYQTTVVTLHAMMLHYIVYTKRDTFDYFILIIRIRKINTFVFKCIP